jgi:hypothetical protein
MTTGSHSKYLNPNLHGPIFKAKKCIKPHHHASYETFITTHKPCVENYKHIVLAFLGWFHDDAKKPTKMATIQIQHAQAVQIEFITNLACSQNTDLQTADLKLVWRGMIGKKEIHNEYDPNFEIHIPTHNLELNKTQHDQAFFNNVSRFQSTHFK